MYARIFRGTIFPLLNRLSGTRIHQILPFLEASERWDRQRLVDLQESKLKRLLGVVEKESAFYREYWRTAGGDRRASSRYALLDGLPIVRKEDLRAATEAFPLSSYRGKVLRVRTSGSTGMPMTFLRSAEQESWFWALRLRMWTWAGWRLGEPYLAINLNARDAWKKRLQDVLFRCRYLTYNSQNVRSSHIIDCLRGGKIGHINAFGSSLLPLARYMREHDIANPGVHALTATGDNLYPEHRQEIESAFGVAVTDYYGAGGEGVHLASQCEESQGYHVHMENAIVEVLRAGRPAAPGEVGTLVVTQLDNDAMPLIRYDLGDLATAGDDRPCACGRSHPTLKSIEGRACDVIQAPNGASLLPQFFFIGVFKNLDGVVRYQVVQETLDRLEIRLVAEPSCDKARCEALIEAEIFRATAGTLTVDCSWIDDIPLTAAGKARPVISRLQQAALAAPSDEVSAENPR